MKTAAILRITAVILFLCGSAFPQGTTGTILGTVKDQSEAAIPGVAIAVTNQGTGLSRTTLTNEVGDYTVSLLPPGTWAKLIDWGYTSMYEGNQTVIDPYNIRASMRGRGTSDLRHRYVLSYVYELPFGRGRAFGGGLAGPLEKFISGWQLTGIMTLQGGFPLTVSLPFDNTNTGGINIPDRIRNPQLPSSGRTIDRWFDTGAFAVPAPFVQGNAGRNYMDGPGYQNFDLGLIKNVRIGENKLVQFRAELFNAFNHPNFAPPDTTLGVPTFGKISSAAVAREIQFGLKVQF